MIGIHKTKKSPYYQYAFTLFGMRFRGTTETENKAEALDFLKRIRKETRDAIIAKSIKKQARFNADKFVSSMQWTRLRYKVLKKSKGKCEACGRSKEDGVILHVDHIKPKSRHPKLALEESNLQVLCGDCNVGKGADDKTDWREKTRLVPE